MFMRKRQRKKLMIMTGLMNNIGDYLDELFPNPKCELNYTRDYELLLATMLSAQTTDKRVNEVTKILFKKYPSLISLSEADVNDIALIIRPIGTFNKKAYNLVEIARRMIYDKAGVLPNDRSYLESLPGVGRKTTNVVLSNIFNEPCLAVDTHVMRVSKRLGLALDGDDANVIEKKLTKLFKGNDLCRRHHQLVLFGRYHCMARTPKCEECKLRGICKYEAK